MIGYVARDKDGEIYLYTEEPTYRNDLEGWYSATNMINITEQFPKFDGISYTDKPIKVEIKLKRLW